MNTSHPSLARSSAFRPLRSLLLCGVVASLYACGGGSDSDSSSPPSSSGFISFSGSSNGDSVVDARNQYAKFRSSTRGMEVAGVTSDIIVDSNNNLVKGGSRTIGKVQLVAGSGGTSIAGMVATDGTMLAIEKSDSKVTLGSSTVRFAAPGSGSGSGSGGGSGSGSGSLQACANLKYPGDTSEPQVSYFDQIAQFDACAYRATGDSRYIEDGNRQCQVLDGILRSTTGNFRPLFCNGPRLKY